MDANDDTTKNLDQNQPAEYDELTNDRLLSDHEYDGIKELDNDLPPWWKYLFYITIILAIVYFLGVHVFGFIDKQADKYDKEMAQAARLYGDTGGGINAETVTIVTDEISLADGHDTFDKICSVCHGKFGEGLIGPNFTDEYWIHGGGIQDMYKIVINGVIEKGMISYKSQLSPDKIQNVLSYIIGFQGTNPPNQKAAEGDLWVNEEDMQDEGTTETDETEVSEGQATS
ncbi:MAG: cbb3-type cytochrome c oxidase N-terminal domain-containing protein [Bacteroidota bacterium]|nr:cbb3-type cytochrome c oxidase N-terminal domain-containing protein [Bacteroidota bacterium]